MLSKILIFLLISTVTLSTALQVPFYPIRSSPKRVPPALSSGHLRSKSIPVYEQEDDAPAWQRAKRNHHDFDDDFHRGNNNNHNGGVTGPIHTFVKTDKNANYKWGVRHHVGPKYV